MIGFPYPIFKATRRKYDQNVKTLLISLMQIYHKVVLIITNANKVILIASTLAFNTFTFHAPKVQMFAIY